MVSIKFIIALTGASGVVYGLRLAEELSKTGNELFIVVTENARKVMNHELPKCFSELKKFGKIYSEKDLDAPFSSGSFFFDAMIVCPCSMNTLSSIACGFSGNLVTRAAQVALKEGRKLVIVPRETPFNSIYLENMLKLSLCGAVILPASPGFYHNPKKIDDLVNHVVGKIMDLIGVSNNIFKRWSQ